MTVPFWAPFLASLLAAAVTTAGLVVIRRYEAWGRANTTLFACFAAGVLISVSFLHIVPTAFSMAAAAPGWLLAGYVVMHLLNRFLSGFVCDRPETVDYAIGLVPLMGIGFHSFIDGAIYRSPSRSACLRALPQSVWRTILRTGRFRRDSDDFKEALVARERCFRSKR